MVALQSPDWHYQPKYVRTAMVEVFSGEQTLRPLPLHTYQEICDPYSLHLNRFHTLIYASAIVALFYHHVRYCTSLVFSSTAATATIWPTLCLFLADAVFAFMWVLSQGFRGRSIRRQPFPERLAERLRSSSTDLLPKLDVFVFTADPEKEPPLVTVNTALSVMAFEYPPEKLSVYISDDGASELTMFAFMEAARFARYWLPFCRENNVCRRSPEEYFATDSCDDSQNDKIKILYLKMKDRIAGAVTKGHVDSNLLITEEERNAISKWRTTGFTRKEHPSVIQVLLESSKDTGIDDLPMPNLVYVSREKITSSPHRFKAGAVNTLLRVSKVMTNAPVVLTLDCDMISNDHRTPLNALCFLLDADAAAAAAATDGGESRPLAFVQFPQRFRGIDEDDIYALEYKRILQLHPPAMDGIVGPLFVGTCTFFRRHALHGDEAVDVAAAAVGISSEEVLGRAHKVAGATYECGTGWGSTIGMRYGSLVEDYHTSYHLHCEGWKSFFYHPKRPAFVGDVPNTLHDVLSRLTRWCVGLMEVAFSDHCPLTNGVRRLPLAAAMCYSYYAFWPTWSVPIIIYGIVPQLALLRGIPLFPSMRDPWIILYLYLPMATYSLDLIESLRRGDMAKVWWNEQRIWLMRGVTCFPMAVFEYTWMHVLGLSSFGFNVTSKVTDDNERKMYEMGKFNLGVDDSPFFLSLGVFALLNLASLGVGLCNYCMAASSSTSIASAAADIPLLQLLLAAFVVTFCFPIYEAMLFRKDAGRMPWKTVKLSFLLTGFLYLIALFVF